MDFQKIAVVVDDDSLSRKVIKAHLNKMGYFVIQCRDGHVGIEILQNNEVDLLVTDLMMPNGNGIDLVKNCRGNSDLFFPIIVLSAVSSIEEEGLDKLNDVHFIEKPFDIQKFKELVSKINS